MASTPDRILTWEFPTSTYAFYCGKVVEVTDEHLEFFLDQRTLRDITNSELMSQKSFFKGTPKPRSHWRMILAKYKILSEVCSTLHPFDESADIGEVMDCRVTKWWKHCIAHRTELANLRCILRPFMKRCSVDATMSSFDNIKVLDKVEFADALNACSFLQMLLPLIH
jgi:hypothetical protein